MSSFKLEKSTVVAARALTLIPRVKILVFR
jgi:hypothetical protein